MNEAPDVHAWSASLVAALEGAGVAAFVTSPGARCAPLIFALDAVGRTPVQIVHDERVAAFLALGMARVSGQPVALISTSGTAAAHWLPAVVEADASGVPLLLLSADRPMELQDCGAPQAMRQESLFTPWTRWSTAAAPHLSEGFHLSAPLAATPLVFAASLGRDAVSRAWGLQPGPVHVNLAFREPLEPRQITPARRQTTAMGGMWRVPSVQLEIAASGALSSGADEEKQSPLLPDRAISAARPRVSADPRWISMLCGERNACERGLIIAGPALDGVDESAAILELGRQSGWPVIADPLSDLRASRNKGVVAHADLILREPSLRQALAPHQVWRFGAMPTSKPLMRSLAEWGADRVCTFSPSGRRLDPLRQARHFSFGADSLLEALPGSSDPVPQSPSASAKLWEQLDLQVRLALADAKGAPSAPAEARIVMAMADSLEAGDTLFVASSMPIRDLDAYLSMHPAGTRIIASRGVNGIDGTIASACGSLCMQNDRGRKGILYIGDVASIHDLSSLRLLRNGALNLRVVVFNNDGGHIFRHLPLAERSGLLTPWFTTPHGESIAEHAHGLGVAARMTDSVEEIVRWILEPWSGPEVLELRLDAASCLERRRAFDRRLGAELRTFHSTRFGADL